MATVQSIIGFYDPKGFFILDSHQLDMGHCDIRIYDSVRTDLLNFIPTNYVVYEY